MMPADSDKFAPDFVAPAGWRAPPSQRGPLWSVGALVKAVADLMEAKFNPVQVKGEIASFTRAASGHCYFTLKDGQGEGQLRCAMFKRAASSLEFQPRDGDLVELRGKLGVYEARGDLQLIVESLERAGQGALFEQFLRLKDRLGAQGLFDPARKRAVPRMPRGIGVVTSQGAAALQDVLAALKRRVPHIPVLLAPACVQGEAAPAELCTALRRLYGVAMRPHDGPPVDVILLVRGGGSLDDLWTFNDEVLAGTMAESPVPVICGVGHETDFTIADFVADLRAPTPTAAAELCSVAREEWLALLVQQQGRLQDALQDQLDRLQQRLDRARDRLSRPSQMLMYSRASLQVRGQRLASAMQQALQVQAHRVDRLQSRWEPLVPHDLERQRLKLVHARQRLALLDPALVLQRGYAWLANEQGQAIGRASQLAPDQSVRATLADGEVDLKVRAVRLQ